MLAKPAPCTNACTALLLLFASTLSFAEPDKDCTPLPSGTQTNADAETQAYAEGLLFQISRGATPSSYIFGTMHVADADIVKLPKEVSEAFDHSTSLVMEAAFDDASVAALSRDMFSLSGPTLDKSLSPHLFESMIELLRPYGIPRQTAARLQPWAAFLTLSIPPQDGKQPLDLVLMERAKEAHRPISGLETLQEQSHVVSELGRNDQLSLLRDVICHHDMFERELVAAKRAYRERQLGKLLTYTTRYVRDGDANQHLLDALLWTRNTLMAARLAPILDQGKAFIAVGALHLTGNRGVLAKLRAEGFNVIRVY